MTDAENVAVAERPERDAPRGRRPAPTDLSSTGAKSNAPPSILGPTLEIRSTTILKLLAYCIVAVITLHLLAMVSWFGFGFNHVKGLVAMFNMEAEKNVPTYFSSAQLFVAAILLGICAARHKWSERKYFKHWVGLAAIFVFLSLDEATLIHEKSRLITQAFFGTSGLLYYSWIIPFGALALAVLATYSRFLLALPRRTGVIFMLSGAVFVAGALGLEMFEGRINEAGGYQSFDYMVLVTIEETLEIVRIYAFIYGLLDYLTGDGRRVDLSLAK